MAVSYAVIYVGWFLQGYFILDLSVADMKLYQIRRELPLIVALLAYIAWRVTPESKPQ